MSNINVRLRELNDGQLREIAQSMGIRFTDKASRESMILTISNATRRNAVKRANVNTTIDRMTRYNSRRSAARPGIPGYLSRCLGINPRSLTTVGRCQTVFDDNTGIYPKPPKLNLPDAHMMSAVGISKNNLTPTYCGSRVSPGLSSGNRSSAPARLRLNPRPMSPGPMSSGNLAPAPVSPRLNPRPMSSGPMSSGPMSSGPMSSGPMSSGNLGPAPVSPRLV